jgi:hypothetical protein
MQKNTGLYKMKTSGLGLALCTTGFGTQKCYHEPQVFSFLIFCTVSLVILSFFSAVMMTEKPDGGFNQMVMAALTLKSSRFCQLQEKQNPFPQCPSKTLIVSH